MRVIDRLSGLVAIALGLASVGGKCDSSSGSDGGTSDDGGSAGDGGVHDAAQSDAAQAATDAGVAATCADVCRCLASACADYPFQPDCVTACQDPTNNPPWDLACRASECSLAIADHDTHCPNASGQTKCH